MAIVLSPPWVENLNPEAEFKLHYREARESQKDLSGLELGLQAGIFPRLENWLELGLELRAAETHPEARPDSIALTDGFSNKTLGLSQAYLAFLSPADHQTQWVVSMGKFQSPFLHTPIGFDSRLRPEGLYQSLSFRFTKLKALLRVHAGQWSLMRVQPNLIQAQKIRRSYLFIQGAEWQQLIAGHTRLRWAVQSMGFNEIAEETARLSIQRGNEGSFSDARTKENFFPVESILEIETQTLGLDLLFLGAFSINPRSEGNDRAFFLSTQVGRQWQQRNFVGRLSYLYLEPNLQLASLLHSEWGYANRKGGEAKVSFFPMDALELSLKGTWSERIQRNLYQDRLIQIVAGVRYQFF